jgi:hypothetical protein
LPPSDETLQLRLNSAPRAIAFTLGVSVTVPVRGTGAVPTSSGVTAAAVGPAGDVAPHPTVIPSSAATIPVRMVFNIDVPSCL